MQRITFNYSKPKLNLPQLFQLAKNAATSPNLSTKNQSISQLKNLIQNGTLTPQKLYDVFITSDDSCQDRSLLDQSWDIAIFAIMQMLYQEVFEFQTKIVVGYCSCLSKILKFLYQGPLIYGRKLEGEYEKKNVEKYAIKSIKRTLGQCIKRLITQQIDIRQYIPFVQVKAIKNMEDRKKQLSFFIQFGINLFKCIGQFDNSIDFMTFIKIHDKFENKIVYHFVNQLPIAISHLDTIIDIQNLSLTLKDTLNIQQTQQQLQLQSEQIGNNPHTQIQLPLQLLQQTINIGKCRSLEYNQSKCRRKQRQNELQQTENKTTVQYPKNIRKHLCSRQMIDSLYKISHKIFNCICQQVITILELPSSLTIQNSKTYILELHLAYYKRVMLCLGQIAKIKAVDPNENIQQMMININNTNHSWGFVDWILTNTFELFYGYNNSQKHNVQFLLNLTHQYNTNKNKHQIRSQLLSIVCIAVVQSIWLILNNLVKNVQIIDILSLPPIAPNILFKLTQQQLIALNIWKAQGWTEQQSLQILSYFKNVSRYSQLINIMGKITELTIEQSQSIRIEEMCNYNICNHKIQVHNLRLGGSYVHKQLFKFWDYLLLYKADIDFSLNYNWKFTNENKNISPSLIEQILSLKQQAKLENFIQKAINCIFTKLTTSKYSTNLLSLRNGREMKPQLDVYCFDRLRQAMLQLIVQYKFLCTYIRICDRDTCIKIISYVISRLKDLLEQKATNNKVIDNMTNSNNWNMKLAQNIVTKIIINQNRLCDCIMISKLLIHHTSYKDLNYSHQLEQMVEGLQSVIVSYYTQSFLYDTALNMLNQSNIGTSHYVHIKQTNIIHNYQCYQFIMLSTKQLFNLIQDKYQKYTMECFENSQNQKKPTVIMPYPHQICKQYFERLDKNLLILLQIIDNNYITPLKNQLQQQSNGFKSYHKMDEEMVIQIMNGLAKCTSVLKKKQLQIEKQQMKYYKINGNVVSGPKLSMKLRENVLILTESIQKIFIRKQKQKLLVGKVSQEGQKQKRNKLLEVYQNAIQLLTFINLYKNINFKQAERQSSTAKIIEILNINNFQRMITPDNIQLYLTNTQDMNQILLTDMRSIIQLYVSGLIGIFHSFAKEYKVYDKTPLLFICVIQKNINISSLMRAFVGQVQELNLQSICKILRLNFYVIQALSLIDSQSLKNNNVKGDITKSKYRYIGDNLSFWKAIIVNLDNSIKLCQNFYTFFQTNQEVLINLLQIFNTLQKETNFWQLRRVYKEQFVDFTCGFLNLLAVMYSLTDQNGSEIMKCFKNMEKAINNTISWICKSIIHYIFEFDTFKINKQEYSTQRPKILVGPFARIIIYKINQLVATVKEIKSSKQKQIQGDQLRNIEEILNIIKIVYFHIRRAIQYQHNQKLVDNILYFLYLIHSHNINSNQKSKYLDISLLSSLIQLGIYHLIHIQYLDFIINKVMEIICLIPGLFQYLNHFLFHSYLKMDNKMNYSMNSLCFIELYENTGISKVGLSNFFKIWKKCYKNVQNISQQHKDQVGQWLKQRSQEMDREKRKKLINMSWEEIEIKINQIQ